MRTLIISIILVSCTVFGYSQQTISEESTVLLLTPSKENSNADNARAKFSELKSAKVVGRLYNQNGEYIIVVPSKNNSAVKKTKKEILAIFPDATIVTEKVSTVNALLADMQNKPTNKK
jgi:hypothetical protein